MLIAFVIGITLGLIANVFFSGPVVVESIINWVIEPVGKLFINMLKMLVVPLVFSALLLGVVEIGNPKSPGRIGGKTLIYILVVTGIAVSIGLTLVNLIPSNPVAAAANGDLLALMMVALLFGIAAAVIRSEATKILVQANQGLYEICMTLIARVNEAQESAEPA